jgi:hypothetical protein
MAKTDPVKALRRLALKYADVEEGIACEGTAVEGPVFRAGKKSFLFVRDVEMRFRLQESIPEMTRLAAKEPKRYQAGAGGWCKVTFGEQGMPPMELVEKWVEESYRGTAATAPKKKPG